MAKTNNLTDFLTALAAKFRAKLGTSATINPQDFEGKIDEVYAAGKKSEYDAFWDAYQENGTRTDYRGAFSGHGWESAQTFYPKHSADVQNAERMFSYNSAEIDLRTSKLSFQHCKRYINWLEMSGVVAVPKIDLSVSEIGAYYLFNQATNLHTVTELAFPGTALSHYLSTGNAFQNAVELQNITVTGTIMNTGFDLHWSTKLTVESLTSILTALSKDSTAASGKTITFPTAAQGKINGDTTAKGQYDAALAAGWTIAFA